MATIIPTFDFDVNGLPTQDLLQRQARSLAISGIGLDEIAGGVRGILTGDASGATGALQAGADVGMMWADPSGRLWVQEQGGPVLLKRYEHGWESRRYWVRPDSGTPDQRAYLAMTGDSTAGPDENFDRSETDPAAALVADEVRLITPSTQDLRNNSTGRFLGVTQETAASNHVRWSGRGLTLFKDHDFLDTDTDVRARVHDMQRDVTLCTTRDSGDTNGAVFQKKTYSDTLDNRIHQAWVAAPTSDATTVSSVDGNHTHYLGWLIYQTGLYQTLRPGSA